MNIAIKAIVNAYVRRIDRGSITVDDVPEEIRNDVKAALEKETKQEE